VFVTEKLDSEVKEISLMEKIIFLGIVFFINSKENSLKEENK